MAQKKNYFGVLQKAACRQALHQVWEPLHYLKNSLVYSDFTAAVLCDRIVCNNRYVIGLVLFY
jgi:hypothetical protein